MNSAAGGYDTDAELRDMLAAASMTETLLQDALVRIGPENLEMYRDDPEEWSALEILCHLLDAEIATGHHLRMVISHSSTQIPAIDEEAVVAAQRWMASDQGLLLQAWSGLRNTNLQLISRMMADDFSRGAQNEAGGSMTVRDMVMEIPTRDRLQLSRLGRLEEKLLRPLA